MELIIQLKIINAENAIYYLYVWEDVLIQRKCMVKMIALKKRYSYKKNRKYLQAKVRV